MGIGIVLQGDGFRHQSQQCREIFRHQIHRNTLQRRITVLSWEEKSTSSRVIVPHEHLKLPFFQSRPLCATVTNSGHSFQMRKLAQREI